MDFASQITRAPDPFEPDRGAETAELFPDAPRSARELLSGVGGCSPYLRGLAEKEAAWLNAALNERVALTFDAILDAVQEVPDNTLKVELREAKRRVALLTALADLGGVWTLEQVTGALTRFADLATDRALRGSLAAIVARGRAPMLENAGDCAGITVLAMGKMGAAELNYSSDIDLICLIDESRYEPADFDEARSASVKVVRNMASMLSDVTSDGYVFRTDLRLRPDPAVTPVCLSMDAAERYYESVGRAWERAAFIKARAAAGDIAAGEAFLDRLSPFVWRRHLDFAAIQDAQSMRLKIREHKGTNRPALEGYDVKLGPGGIREIEFYTQTRQIIAGGRDPDLRLRGTVEALGALQNAGWTDASEQLSADYRAHREVEHRLQMIGDLQTHLLPTAAEGFARLSAFMGMEEATLRHDLKDRLSRVGEITDEFFTPQATTAAPELSETAAEVVARWPTYPALRSERASEIFDRVKPQLLSRLTRAARPEEALGHLDGFLKGLPAGVQLFSLFDANPQLIDLIVDIAATSPALAQHLSRHSAVLDAVIGGSFFADWPGSKALSDDLAQTLQRAGDYESQLLAARIWRNEWHFRVGVHHLRGHIDGATSGRQYAAIAGTVLHALWPAVVTEFARKHGDPPGRGAAIIGMGSLGAEALSAVSDLDLIVIYDPGDQDTSTGPRPLDARTYFARLTQAYITALTAPMGPGRLYEVDMRLRPSGRKGPVATSLSAFQTYQTDEAWTWEHLALTRARPIAGTFAIAEDVEAFRRTLLQHERDKWATLKDVSDMRARLSDAKPGSGLWDVKSGVGRLQDIELLAQAGALLSGSSVRRTMEQIDAGAGALGLSGDDVATLKSANDLFWSVRAAARLVTGEVFEPKVAGAGGREFMLRETGEGDMEGLEKRIREGAKDAEHILGKILGRDEQT